MRKLRLGAAVASLLMTLAFVASAQAVTPQPATATVTSPADGTSLLLNQVTNPNQTFTVSGTSDGTTGDFVDIDCYYNGTEHLSYSGSGTGIPVLADGSFSADVPLSTFAGNSCELLAVPHGTSPTPGTSYLGPGVGFSSFATNTITGGANSGTVYDYTFEDVTTLAGADSSSIDSCGPFTYLVDGTSAMNVGPRLFYCAGSFFNSANDLGGGEDLPTSEILVDGQNAYGSYSAQRLFGSSNTLSGFPALSANLDSLNTSNGDAQTTESEQLVKCTPEDVYAATSSTCTAFASTGVSIKRVTDYTDSGRVATVTDVYTSTDGQAHSLDLQYETDLLGTTSGWELPGQTSFTTPSSTVHTTDPGPSTGPGTAYAIADIGSAPSVANPVGALTFSIPYTSVTFDDTLWGAGNPSALFEFTPMVPAGGSTSITWSYATGSSMAEVQGYAATAQAEMQDAAQPPAVAISSPANGATETSTPVTVTGTASAGSGVASVTVNGVAATISGDSWSASVPLTAGSNTLTATLTSDAGNTATATTTVTYTPPATVNKTPSGNTPPAPARPQIVVKSRRFNGKAVLVKLACAAGGANCAGKITLRYTHTVVKHHKKHRTTVTVASRGYALAAGHTATISVGLNATGRRLLKADHKLPGVKGTVTLSGGHAKTFALTLKQPKKHKK